MMVLATDMLIFAAGWYAVAQMFRLVRDAAVRGKHIGTGLVSTLSAGALGTVAYDAAARLA